MLVWYINTTSLFILQDNYISVRIYKVLPPEEAHLVVEGEVCDVHFTRALQFDRYWPEYGTVIVD